MEIDKEIIIEYNKIALEHTESLWKIASALAVVNILLIAHLRKVTGVDFRRRLVSFLVFFSACSCVFSVAFGYLSNSAVVASFQSYATSGKWSPDTWAEIFTLGQIVALLAGVLTFGVVFWIYKEVLAEALIHVLPGGGEG